MPERAELIVELRLLRATIEGLRSDLAERRADRLTPTDRVKLSALLPVVALAVADRAFTVADVVELARLPGETALRDALVAAGGPHRVGHLFRRADDVDVDGLTVASIGEDRNGRVWRLRRESPHTRRIA